MAAQIHTAATRWSSRDESRKLSRPSRTSCARWSRKLRACRWFKGRREMSERKLERVKENLARVDDVLRKSSVSSASRADRPKKRRLTRSSRRNSATGTLRRGRRLIDQREELATQTGRDAELKSALDGARAGAAAIREQVEGAASAAHRRGRSWAGPARARESPQWRE